MIKVSYDRERNAVIIEFAGKINIAEAERSYPEIQKVVSKAGKGFKLLTDLTLVEVMESEVQATIKKTMDFLNKQGVTEIMRVVPAPEKDLGFNILSLFHYSKKVRFLTLNSREEAEERLNGEDSEK